MLLDGHGVEARCRRRLPLVSESRRGAGDLDGINMLGRCYENGWGVSVDRVRAMELFRKAAAKSHAWAQFNLGMLLLHDSGHPGDAATALTLFVRSARQGNAKVDEYDRSLPRIRLDRPRRSRIGDALVSPRCQVGGCFRGASHLARFLREQGRAGRGRALVSAIRSRGACAFLPRTGGTSVCDSEAEHHAVAREALKRAAEGDEAADLFAYGHALVQGRGGPVDLREAAIWLGRAQAKGFPGALALLDDACRQRAAIKE